MEREKAFFSKKQMLRLLASLLDRLPTSSSRCCFSFAFSPLPDPLSALPRTPRSRTHPARDRIDAFLSPLVIEKTINSSSQAKKPSLSRRRAPTTTRLSTPPKSTPRLPLPRATSWCSPGVAARSVRRRKPCWMRKGPSIRSSSWTKWRTETNSGRLSQRGPRGRRCPTSG